MKTYKTISIAVPKEQIAYLNKKAKQLHISKSKLASEIFANWQATTNGRSNCEYQNEEVPCAFTNSLCRLFQKDAVNCKFYSSEEL